MVSLSGQFHILLMVLLAAILGALIGLERERANKPAGARTQSLVAAAASMVVSAGAVIDQIHNTGDPTRAMHAVITGIGFLGAGIMSGGGKWAGRGITTATTVFTTAAIGCIVGLDMPITGLGATVIVLISLRLGRILKKVVKRDDIDEPISRKDSIVSDDWLDEETIDGD